MRTAIDRWLDGSEDIGASDMIHAALDAAVRFIQARQGNRDAPEAGARGLSATLARCAAAALLARQANGSTARGDARPAAALRRFAGHGLRRLHRQDTADIALLLG